MLTDSTPGRCSSRRLHCWCMTVSSTSQTNWRYEYHRKAMDEPGRMFHDFGYGPWVAWPVVLGTGAGVLTCRVLDTRT
jgi:hypothetical protein